MDRAIWSAEMRMRADSSLRRAFGFLRFMPGVHRDTIMRFDVLAGEACSSQYPLGCHWDACVHWDAC